MQKRWIAGYEGKYEITDTGEVYSYKQNGNIRSIGTQHGTGYKQTYLSKRGTGVYKLVHRLVAEAFIPNPENLEVVDHIDEDKMNNCVSNLRWCTLKQNNTFYVTKDGRDHHTELRRKHKIAVNNLLSEVKKEKAEVLRLTKELATAGMALTKEQAKFKAYVEETNEKILTSGGVYTGYKDTTGLKFESHEKMVSLVGKKITVAGTEFSSCGGAATWITEQEALLGNVRNRDTISKELRRFLQGRRGSWEMYDRYLVGA